jgi:integrase/recombinase XerD
MATDFAVFLHRFLTSCLAGVRGCPASTIASCRDTFKLLIGWFASQRQVPPEKLTLERIDAAAITGFLGWLETSRNNSASTRNARRAAITSFLRLLQSEEPAPDGRLPGDPRHPRQEASRAGRRAPHRRPDPAAARRARPSHTAT